MNESIFLSHTLLIVFFVFLALRFGKSSLISFITLQAVLANLFVVKQTSLFGFTVTCSDMFAVGSILGLNVLQEYYGKEAAAQGVKISFLGMVFFAVMSQVHLLYAPSPADQTAGAFQTIFSSTPRIFFASIAVFGLIQKIDVRLFSALRFLSSFPIRVGVSLFISQFLDTVFFSFLGLYGLVESIFDVILLSFCMKCLCIFCSSSLVAFARRFAKVGA